MTASDFPTLFQNLTGNLPFSWQTALYERISANTTPDTANIPTGLGKTSIVAIWLIALAQHPDHVPRRLVYVVNRRTVVDQTTADVEGLRNALTKPKLTEFRDALASLCALPLPTLDAPPLAISTLRGQFADNGEWCTDPSRPAAIVGTVDMIGSGLLFSRYTRGFKTRPLHAGFLAQDALLVHDEAHLEPSFQKLLESIVAAQDAAGDLRKLRVIELTATSRTANANGNAKPFGLDENPNDKDTDNETVKQRINAVKQLSLVALGEGEKLDAKLVTLANQCGERAKEKSGERAVLVFARSVEAVVKVAAELDKGERKGKVATLTGTMRGKERDELVKFNAVFQRFLPPSSRSKEATPADGTVFLVATSAGEVGVNLSADDLVCDLSTYESMAQRFGRVNRFGDTPDCTVTIVHETKFDTENKKTGASEAARERTLALLQKLDGNASPAALDKLNADERTAAFSPEPDRRIAAEIQFDAWALTSVREPIAARPAVAPYLHGEAEWQPETHLAWREELDVIDTAGLRDAYPPADLLEDFPLKPHELLRDTSKRVFAAVKESVERFAATCVDGNVPNNYTAWFVSADNDVEPVALSRFLTEDDLAIGALEAALANATLVLPASLGGIEKGLLTPDAAGDADHKADVADIVAKGTAGKLPYQRIRVWSDKPDVPPVLAAAGFHRIRFIDTLFGKEDTEEAPTRFWLWLETRSGSTTSTRADRDTETLTTHTAAVVANATAIAAKIFTIKSAFAAGEPDLRRCIVIAARLHDLGKNRAPWQRNLGNLAFDPAKPETILAKSAPGMRPRNIAEHYRHEFGSLNDSSNKAEFTVLSDAERDIVLHLVAAHHGRARPHFPADEIGDCANSAATAETDAILATETPRRFARLQKRFGRWGLAWLESLFRAADYAASAGIVASAQSNLTESVHAITPSQTGRSPFTTITSQAMPTATLAVNPANPGHYFACYGLFELAARLSPDALAWFEQNSATRQWRFHLANTPTLADLVEKITASEIKVLDNTDNHSAVEIASPFYLRLDWWRYENRATGKLKTWAGQMKASSILATLRAELKKALPLQDAQNLFAIEAMPTDAVSYFDAPRSANAAARDVGFSMDKLKKGGVVFQNVLHPFVEFFCLLGLQRTRPALLQHEPRAEQTYVYHLWLTPISIAISPVAAIGKFPDCGSTQYHFANPSRTQDYRAFITANAVPTR